MLCVRAAARKQWPPIHRLSKLRTSYPYHSGNPSQNVVRRACIHHPHSSVCVWLHWRRLDLGSRVTDVAPCLPYGALLTQRDLQHFQSSPWARNFCLPFHFLGFLQNSKTSSFCTRYQLDIFLLCPLTFLVAFDTNSDRVSPSSPVQPGYN